MLATIVLCLLGCEQSVNTLFIAGATMGTQYSITVIDAGDIDKDVLRNDVDRLLRSVNQSMSTYDPESELSRLNNNPSTDWIEISEPLHTVLRAAISIADDSGGAFDVSVGQLVNLWGFGHERGTGRLPDASALADAREQVGTDKFELRDRPRALRKRHAKVAIDLSAIAKGYAVDRLADLLSDRGRRDFLVDIGGELRASGTNSRGVSWRIGIENPINDGRDIGRTISLTNTGLASSGNYRNFFEVDGVRYGHTIDPKTGSPTQHHLAGVSVLHPSAMIADAWATALMSLGYEAGLRAAKEHDLAALFFVEEADKWNTYTTTSFGVAMKRMDSSK